MGKYILEGMEHINWMGIFALVTFVIVFLLSIYLIFKKDDKVLKRLENMPLDDD
ncbi:MAG: hypothetical protein J5I52_05590 [Saprospiraceae bacterium]|nr:MAG: hypothetical protein UZ09_BCD002000094 [Bacteroidetes bacterium OLB9]MCO6463603.1 hypothetical protein [Saprospiraceae bacterium]MCZ2337998.1 hypothetical protein [Chitinophagales bacterium]